MPYISKEQVAEIRKELKNKYPEFKFSVRREHYSVVRCVILSGPEDLGTTRERVNEYWIDKNYSGRKRDLLQGISDILNKDCRIMFEDADYGSIPNYYTSLSIGDYDRPYNTKREFKKGQKFLYDTEKHPQMKGCYVRILSKKGSGFWCLFFDGVMFGEDYFERLELERMIEYKNENEKAPEIQVEGGPRK